MQTDTTRKAVWLVLLAAAGTFALTMGTRQTMGLFLSPMNTSTGLGVGSISLAFAFAFGQLWWGLTQPFAGAVADRVGITQAGVFRHFSTKQDLWLAVAEWLITEAKNVGKKPVKQK